MPMYSIGKERNGYKDCNGFVIEFVISSFSIKIPDKNFVGYYAK
jgi:hypothetical protein